MKGTSVSELKQYQDQYATLVLAWCQEIQQWMNSFAQNAFKELCFMASKFSLPSRLSQFQQLLQKSALYSGCIADFRASLAQSFTHCENFAYELMSLELVQEETEDRLSRLDQSRFESEKLSLQVDCYHNLLSEICTSLGFLSELYKLYVSKVDQLEKAYLPLICLQEITKPLRARTISFQYTLI